jgi:1-acyl-sn-glycerol-3-phosphate acyltransferase
MNLLTILIVIVIVGVVLWLINNYVPMQPSIKKILNIVAVIILIIWLLSAFGVWHYLGNVHL